MKNELLGIALARFKLFTCLVYKMLFVKKKMPQKLARNAKILAEKRPNDYAKNMRKKGFQR